MSRFFSLAVVAVVMAGGAAHAQEYGDPAVGVSAGSFEASLSPYGAWYQHPRYGRIWQPAPAYVGSDFYPYGTGGQWVWTDAGWSFESSYPFAWATFHYGRWMLEPGYGWVWIPGYQWAPAWVSWRYGGAYVGWAPLGLYGAPAFASSHWCFVEHGSFTSPNVYGYSVGPNRFHDAVAVTQSWDRRGPGREYAGAGMTPPLPRGGSYAGAGSPMHRQELRPSFMGPTMNHGVVGHEERRGEFAPGPNRERSEEFRHGGFAPNPSFGHGGDFRQGGAVPSPNFGRSDDFRRGGGTPPPRVERFEDFHQRGFAPPARSAPVAPSFRAPPAAPSFRSAPSAPSFHAAPSAPAFHSAGGGFGGRRR